MPIPPVLYYSKNGKLDNGSKPGDVLQCLKDHPAKDFVLYFHGGVTQRDGAKKDAEAISVALGGRALLAAPQWDSSPDSAIKDEVLAFTRRHLVQVILDKVAPLVAHKSASKGLAFSDLTEDEAGWEFNAIDEEVLAEALLADPRFHQEAAILGGGQNAAGLDTVVNAEPDQRDLNLQAQLTSRLDQDQRTQIAFMGLPEVSAWLLLKAIEITKLVLERHSKGRARELKETILEAVVKSLGGVRQIWDQNKNDAVASYKPGGAMALVIEELANAPQLLKDRRFILAGHSAGSIHIREFLLSAPAKIPGARFDVRLFAPADRVSAFVPALAAAEQQITSFRSFNLTQVAEAAEPLLKGFAPDLVADRAFRGSILHLVSGALEDPIDCPLIGMERHRNLPQDSLLPEEKTDLRKLTDVVEKIRSKTKNAPDAWIWCPTSGPNSSEGLRSVSKTHSGCLIETQNMADSILLK